jgi:hypothetical protein
MIPKIIWQTYESEYDELPQLAKDFSKTWIEKNSDWEYRYVSGKERRNFVKNNFNEEWLEIYDSYKFNVMRSDLWRYLCIFKLGGLYVDLDTTCNIPIEDWLDITNGFVVSTETEEIYSATQLIFAAEKENSILKNILRFIKIEYSKNIRYEDKIDYIKNNVGYEVFTKGILNYLKITNFSEPNLVIASIKNNFYCFSGSKSKVIHNKAITHHNAGSTDIFGNKYTSWGKEEYK